MASSRGDLGPAESGISFRDSEGNFKEVVSIGIGESEIFWEESLAILRAAEIAVSMQWLNLWLESDSAAVVVAFKTDKVPWKLKESWINCKRSLQQVKITHIWREANLVADQVANFASYLEPGREIRTSYKPDWIVRWENPNDIFERDDIGFSS